jgi:hypothetical protein
MSDRADEPERRPTTRLAELQVVQFVSDALRAGKRAILVTGHDQVSTRVPDAALAASAGASARVLHITPPLPEPFELQERIGAAAGIAGGREMTPQAMAGLLLSADPRATVILAIDDAHTLPHPALHYLALMTELLAPEPPILQIVLAAGPALLDTLARPEFAWLKNRLCRPGFEARQTLGVGRAEGAFSGLRRGASGYAAAGLAHPQHADPAAAVLAYHEYVDRFEHSTRGYVIPRSAVYVAGGLGCLAAIGYIAFSAFFDGPTSRPIPSINSATEPLGAGNGNQAGLSSNAAEPAIPSAASNQNVDAAPAPPIASDAPIAIPADSLDAARNRDQAGLSPNAAEPAIPSAASNQNVDAAPPPPIASDAPIAIPADSLDVARNGDQAGLSPNVAEPAPPTAVSNQNFDETQPAILAKAASTAADGVAARVVAGLPALAPVRVILSMAGDDAGRARRSADIERALTAAGLEVSDFASDDARQAGPSIGYYFQSDRKAAAEVSHLLEPLIGAVGPVVLRKRGAIPEPGTIEVALP